MRMKSQPLDFEKPIADLEQKLDELRGQSRDNNVNLDPEVSRMESKIEEMKRHVYSGLTAWQRVQIARHTARPYTLDYLQLSFSDFVELHGDRRFADDPSMPGGLATIGRHKCAIIGHQKGRDTKENIKHNFGCANPEGYRKAMRLMRMAEKFGMPFVSLIDTPGAYPGIGAEERHIAESIAANIRDMMTLRAPTVAVVIGEGGSGGALGIAVSDRVLILENAYYSVISPEGCAAILWKHRKHAPDAAQALKLTARDLQELKLVDDVIPEPLGGAHQDHGAAIDNLRKAVVHHLDELTKIPMERLLEERYQKFRRMGFFAGE